MRERVAAAEVAGFGREGPPLSAAELRAALAAAAAESRKDEQRFSVRLSLGPRHDGIAAGLVASTMTTGWQHSRDGRRTAVSFPTFRRHLIEKVRPTDPARLTVPMPEPAFGDAMELDYGQMGMWTDRCAGHCRAC